MPGYPSMSQQAYIQNMANGAKPAPAAENPMNQSH